MPLLLHGPRVGTSIAGLTSTCGRRTSLSFPILAGPIPRTGPSRPSSAAAVARTPRWRDHGQRHAENVWPESLRDTLEAHRDANRASVIHKVVPGTGRRVALDWSQEGEGDEAGPTGAVYPSVRRPQPVRTARSSRGAAEQDYIAKVAPLTRLWAPAAALSATSRYPWLAYLDDAALRDRHGPGVDRLTHEITAFNAYFHPTSDESAAASMAIDDIRQTLHLANDQLQVDLVGSRASGLATALSDIDLNVSPTSPGTLTRGPSRPMLSILQRSIRQVASRSESVAARSVAIKHFRKQAHVPIICGVHLPTHLDFQIQCTQDVSMSLQHTKALLAEYPTLPGLFQVVKQMLVMRGLWAGQGHGMTAYPLTIMIAAALQLGEGQHHRWAAGSHLLAFLDMYADIDFYATGISLSPVRYTRKVARSPSGTTTAASSSDPVSGWQPTWSHARPWLMSLEDPANAGNDLGRSIMQIKDIQATFIRIRHQLDDAVQAWERAGENDQPVPLLACGLEGDYRIFDSERRDLRRAIKTPPPI